MVEPNIELLHTYTACDISDALLKLQGPGPAGHIPHIRPYAPSQPSSPERPSVPKTIAPASTVLFGVKPAPPPSEQPPASLPPNTHFADLTPSGTIVVISQPQETFQTNAVLGGIVATRMKVLGAKGVVVDGNVRDVRELSALGREDEEGGGFHIWARGTSTAGAGAGSVPLAVQTPLTVGETVVKPGDIIVSDPLNGVVCIPRDLLSSVLELLPGIVAADDRVIEDVRRGVGVKEAFRRHRN
ncbi:MAG: hypothetical protein M1833_004528 [Piccolia ochrophora]|nr:MAG: hypothetical protein M1833_004528 [Piccolia ochrophora]